MLLFICIHFNTTPNDNKNVKNAEHSLSFDILK